MIIENEERKIMSGDVDKIAYMLLKNEGVDYELCFTSRGRVRFLFERDERNINTVIEWNKIKDNNSNEKVNIGEFIFYREFVLDVIKEYKRSNN